MLFKKRALIFGISGQDGSYLAKLLQKKNYLVFGTSRNPKKIHNLKKIGLTKIKVFKIDNNDYDEVYKTIKKSRCNQIYYLSGVSSVSLSNKIPFKTIFDNTNALFNIYESCKKLDKKIRIYSSSSSECFGNQKKKIDDKTKHDPLSPYGLSKSINYHLTKHYRSNLGLFCVTGFSFNHDSILRPNNYVLKKVIKFCSNKKNINKKLSLGNINIVRDWGWAPEHVNFIYKILQLKKPSDFVIGTGKSTSLKKIIELIFQRYGFKTSKNIKIDKKKFRKNDIKKNCANISKLKLKLNDYPKTKINHLIDRIIYKNFNRKSKIL
jgi:GDPmannose 4,6-dehydratase|tara:strand:+ start:290 stop:1255 length:966 start_codon:yes stop_codon:yes gene_type:complete